MPLVWFSSMRRVIRSALATRSVTDFGSNAVSVCSSERVPSSTCCKATVARNVFMMLPARIRSCGRMGVRAVMSASPALPDQGA